MATPTQTTAAVFADGVGSNPTIAAGVTFVAGRQVVVELTVYNASSNAISDVAIGGTSGSIISRYALSSGTAWVEQWLVDGVGSGTSNINVTISGSGMYLTAVAREWAASTFSGIDTGADAGVEGSSTTMDLTTAAGIASADSVTVATYYSGEATVSVGFIGISGFSGVVLQQDNNTHNSIMTGYREESSTGSKTANGTQTSTYAWYGAIGVLQLSAGSPATLSSPTPSGTLGTTTTATIGATTDQTTGTFYAVVGTGSQLTGVTAIQIKAGQQASGSAAIAADSNTVTTTSPTADITGLSAATAYTYAAIQNNANGDSNIVTGTFTTASGSASPLLKILQQASIGAVVAEEIKNRRHFLMAAGAAATLGALK